MNLYQTLKHKYPNVDIDKEVILRQDEGEPYILQWHSPEPQPTTAELQSYWDEFKDAITDFFKPEPTKIEQLEKAQADLTFNLMMNGVL